MDAVLPAAQHLVVIAEQLHGLQYQVIEIKRVIRVQLSLIAAVYTRHAQLNVVLCQGNGLFRHDAIIFPAGDLPVKALCFLDTAITVAA